MKKLLDRPDAVIDDMVVGIIQAHPAMLAMVGDTGRSIVRAARTSNKVGIVIGGGSGHEPAFVGYVGNGLADGVALGNIFASPSPDPIVDAARAVNSGQGVLLIYGNYAGDCMNFEMAAELLEDEGIMVRRIIVNDDVASSDNKSQRRGIAGEVLIYKIAGALANQGYDLSAIAELTQSAIDNTFTMGAAWTPCTLPGTGLSSFEIGEDEMEIGLGVHGEPGIRRQRMTSASELSEIILTRLSSEMSAPMGPIALLVNGLGSTSLMELYAFYGKLHLQLQSYGAQEVKVLVGNYITSQEMGGCSVSIMRLDELRTKAMEASCHSLGWTQ